MPLEDYYGGDAGFHEFALACAPEWPKCACQEQLVNAVGGDVDLAIVIHYHIGDPMAWLDSVAPMLEGLTPRQCLASDAGRKRLKEALWRMP